MNNLLEKTVEKIVCIPHDFNIRRNVSEITLLQESGYIELHNQIHEEEITEILKLRPHLIDEWLEWSADNRSNFTWYFTRGNDGKCFVGHIPDGKEFEEINTTDQFKACAAFIKRKIESTRINIGRIKRK